MSSCPTLMVTLPLQFRPRVVRAQKVKANPTAVMATPVQAIQVRRGRMSAISQMPRRRAKKRRYTAARTTTVYERRDAAVSRCRVFLEKNAKAHHVSHQISQR